MFLLRVRHEYEIKILTQENRYHQHTYEVIQKWVQLRLFSPKSTDVTIF